MGLGVEISTRFQILRSGFESPILKIDIKIIKRNPKICFCIKFIQTIQMMFSNRIFNINKYNKLKFKIDFFFYQNFDFELGPSGVLHDIRAACDDAA